MLEVIPNSQWTKNGVEFHLVNRAGGLFVAAPVVFNEVKEGFCDVSPPAFFLRADQVQNLMDRLWEIGYRPSEGTGSAGALKQAEDHIASLKKIAFTLVEKPTA